MAAKALIEMKAKEVPHNLMNKEFQEIFMLYNDAERRLAAVRANILRSQSEETDYYGYAKHPATTQQQTEEYAANQSMRNAYAAMLKLNEKRHEPAANAVKIMREKLWKNGLNDDLKPTPECVIS